MFAILLSLLHKPIHSDGCRLPSHGAGVGCCALIFTYPDYVVVAAVEPALPLRLLLCLACRASYGSCFTPMTVASACTSGLRKQSSLDSNIHAYTGLLAGIVHTDQEGSVHALLFKVGHSVMF